MISMYFYCEFCVICEGAETVSSEKRKDCRDSLFSSLSEGFLIDIEGCTASILFRSLSGVSLLSNSSLCGTSTDLRVLYALSDSYAFNESQTDFHGLIGICLYNSSNVYLHAFCTHAFTD